MRIHGSILLVMQQKNTFIQRLIKMTGTIATHAELNRLEYLRDSGAQLPKHHKVTCSNCSSTGHNKLQCIHPCNFYNHTPFCAHL